MKLSIRQQEVLVSFATAQFNGTWPPSVMHGLDRHKTSGILRAMNALRARNLVRWRPGDFRNIRVSMAGMLLATQAVTRRLGRLPTKGDL